MSKEMDTPSTEVFLDNQIIDYLFQILRDGIPVPGLTIPLDEQKAILKIWESAYVYPVTTSALYREVEFKRGGESPAVLAKIGDKLGILSVFPRRSSTALSYGEGVYNEGCYQMPLDYHSLLNLFKDPNAQSAKRDAQHILNCHDNSIRYLITLDGEMLTEIAQATEVKNLGVLILKPITFVSLVPC